RDIQVERGDGGVQGRTPGLQRGTAEARFVERLPAGPPLVDEPATAYLDEFPVILPVLLLSLSIASVFYQQYSKRVKEEEAKK
ncbi:MAG: hypothetical protein AAGK78_15820, partial [Planctomycetota bacterium]